MVLLSEEVTLLLEQKVARLVCYPSLQCAPRNDVRQKFQEYRKTMYEQQVCKIKLDSKIVGAVTPNPLTFRMFLSQHSKL